MTKVVLVTGASTGIGRHIIELVADDGCVVFAGARKASDLRLLARIENVCPLRLDVTNPHDIDAAVVAIRDYGHGLYGLVNNAGVGTLGPIIGGNDGEFDLVMAVNVAGVYRVTKAMVPMVVVGGRVVMIGSISGILAERNVGVYSMSKHAIEALTDSLALELADRGVHVSVVEPGDYDTSICRNASERGVANAATIDRSRCRPPDEVAKAVSQALFEPRPKRRYLVVSHEDEAHQTIRKQIAQLVQLNEGHAYTYDRAALVKMLDEMLSVSRSAPFVSPPRVKV